MTARPDVTTPRTPDRRLTPRLQVSGATPEQLRAWRAAAKRAGVPLAAWIRAACDAAIGAGVVGPEIQIVRATFAECTAPIDARWLAERSGVDLAIVRRAMASAVLAGEALALPSGRWTRSRRTSPENSA